LFLGHFSTITKKGARIFLVPLDEVLCHKVWHQTPCYVLAVRGWKHITVPITLCMCDLSVEIRYMCACTVIGEVPNKITLCWLFVIFMVQVFFSL